MFILKIPSFSSFLFQTLWLHPVNVWLHHVVLNMGTNYLYTLTLHRVGLNTNGDRQAPFGGTEQRGWIFFTLPVKEKLNNRFIHVVPKMEMNHHQTNNRSTTDAEHSTQVLNYTVHSVGLRLACRPQRNWTRDASVCLLKFEINHQTNKVYTMW